MVTDRRVHFEEQLPRLRGELRIGIASVHAVRGWLPRRLVGWFPNWLTSRLPRRLVGYKMAGRTRWLPWRKNLLVDNGSNGLNYLRDLVLGTQLFPVAMALGTGTAPAVAADAALKTEVFRKAITRRTSSNKVAKLQTLVLETEANGFAIAEAGVFSSTVAGQGAMLSRVTFDPVSKTSSIQMTLEWRYTLSLP